MNKVGIIGGMGPYAGLDYLHCFLDECTSIMRGAGVAVSDQSYPSHYLFQHPVLDRTAALINGPAEYAIVFADLHGQMQALKSLGVKTVAISCNTAHAWHADLQHSVPEIQIIHIAQAAAKFLATKSVSKVGLLATAGTVRSGLYARALNSQGIECLDPDENELKTLMLGIYDGVKSGDMPFALISFKIAINALKKRTGVKSFLMACTEIPLALTQANVAPDIVLYDPTRISAQRLAQIALEPSS